MKKTILAATIAVAMGFGVTSAIAGMASDEDKAWMTKRCGEVVTAATAAAIEAGNAPEGTPVDLGNDDYGCVCIVNKASADNAADFRQADEKAQAAEAGSEEADASKYWTEDTTTLVTKTCAAPAPEGADAG